MAYGSYGSSPYGSAQGGLFSSPGFSYGFNLDPQTLSQIAAAAFRPPQTMNMAPLNLQATPASQIQMAPQQTGQQGSGQDDGLNKLAGALGTGLGKWLSGGYTGDPAASAAYGSARPALPSDYFSSGGIRGGGV